MTLKPTPRQKSLESDMSSLASRLTGKPKPQTKKPKKSK